MAQADYVIGANQSGLSARTEIDTIFQAILTNNSGSTAPTVTSAFMMWVDTSDTIYYYLKKRNHDNSAWISIARYTIATKIIELMSNSVVINDTNYVHMTGNETIAGTKTFSTSPIIPTPITTGNIITMGSILEKTPVGLGYGTGAGGTVTQLTSKSTSVTLNKPCGVITMNNAALAAGVTTTFALNNSLIAAADGVIVTLGAGSYTPYAYNIWCYPIANILTIYIKNISGESLSEPVVINFTIIRGA